MTESSLKVSTHGQVFTPPSIVQYMLSLRKNKGSVLEPSCGDGAFASQIPGCTALELDPDVCPTYAINQDFFTFNPTSSFDTIIGNPPYVRYQDILAETKEKLDHSLFDGRSNLYLFFIARCIDLLADRGELIFIVPREFLKATSAIKLNKFIYAQGTITDILDLGDTKVFKGASPNCVIFRFEKNRQDRKTSDGKVFQELNGQLLFLSKKYPVTLSDLFYVKVGGVSGNDQLFSSSEGSTEFVCSTTCKTGTTKSMFYGSQDKEKLEPVKQTLISRKIRKFTEDNWWEWGREFHKSDKPRIYVNAKTRNNQPFFTHPCLNYDGSILALFPKYDMQIDLAIQELNQVDWQELGFVCNGRHLFSQKSLENSPLPEQFLDLLKT